MGDLGCEDAPLEERLDMIRSAIMTNRIGKDILVRTEEKDGWFAGVIRCVSLPEITCPRGWDSCALLKSAYIFDDEKDAAAWLKETMADIRKTITTKDLLRVLAMVAKARSEHKDSDKE